MDEGRKDHLQMIQGIIERMAQNSFQLKGWTVTLAAALEVFLKGEARPAWLFVPSLPVIAFWLTDAWYLRRERLFRRLFDHVQQKMGRRTSRWMSALSPTKSGQCSPLPCHRPSSAFTVRCCSWRLPSQ